jgi:hypothetical protein
MRLNNGIHNMMFIKLIMVFLFTAAMTNMVIAQSKEYEGPDDPAGDIDAEREAWMDGNRIFLYFQNTSELSDWPRENASLWPNNFEGTRMLDGVGLLVGARVYIQNDTIPIENPVPGVEYDTLFFLQTSYRQQMDTDPTGTIEWGFYPVHGYFNRNSEYPAISNRENSWPIDGWPSTGNELKWPGEWNGRFGRGVKYADLETFFVVNDAHDQESLGPEDVVKYFPRPGTFIGDKNPDVTIQYGKPWGGLGLRVEQRGFQWNNPQARDAIFWEYSIANISDYDLPEVAFGYWVDTWIGGESASDDVGYFDTNIDMAYSWDTDGIGFGGRQSGTLGFAYLESPGVPEDMVDNDQDGLTDEKRNNDAGNIIGPYDGITNLNNFLAFYKLNEEDLKEHYEGDEDQDWQDWIDTNNNGIYDEGEEIGDDVGLDGVGPGDLNYNGPDEGEANHKPDYQQGVGSEPNFNATDVSESDMIGLTSFRLFNIPDENSSYHWFRGDKSMWELIGEQSLPDDFWSGSLSNLILTFASGPFLLRKGTEERISMSELHSYDPLTGLNSSSHSATALFEQKRIVQVIYEKDYRFAQPPLMPTLTATAGDGKVILTWDNRSDTKTRDPFLGNVNDFEGYKLFRATDKKFSDPEIITDGFGTKSGLKPIFQCDKIDDILGFAEYGNVNGALYYLGDESGLVHHFVDNTVQNGRTYYYALVAYDYGDESLGISPSENNIIIDLDESENIRFVGQNVQVVIPRQNAAGYEPPEIEVIENDNLIGSGDVMPEILSKDLISPNSEYKIKFDIDTNFVVSNYDHGLVYTTSGFYVYDVTNGNSIVYSETPEYFVGDNIRFNDTLNYYYLNDFKEIESDVFAGLKLRINQPLVFPQLDYENSGWMVGDGMINITTTPAETYYFPWDYDIIFEENAYTSKVTNTRPIRDENGTSRLSNLLTGVTFNFKVLNRFYTDSTGDFEKLDIVAQDLNLNGQFDIDTDRAFVGPLKTTGSWAGTLFILDFIEAASSGNLPGNDDRYYVTFRRPFFTTDSIMFKIVPEVAVNINSLTNSLNDIKVVPNPYIGTNSMEPAVSNRFLNQRRRLMFTHIPANCAIKIFTVSGVLVDEILVDNEPSNGIVHWDLLSSEGLEVAAGMYIYTVESNLTGDKHMGKFALIK